MVTAKYLNRGIIDNIRRRPAGEPSEPLAEKSFYCISTLACASSRLRASPRATAFTPHPRICERSMEKMPSSPPLPCKFASTGCPLTLQRAAKLEHEELCKFQLYSCPCPGTPCRWQGSMDAVIPHLKQQHKSITTLQGRDILFTAAGINLPGTVNWVMVQSCFGFHFLLVLEKRERPRNHQQFFALVLLIGTRKQAKKFIYRLELSDSCRLLAWEATPHSILEGVASVITNTDCLVFDKATAHLFAENGNLDINVSICYT